MEDNNIKEIGFEDTKVTVNADGTVDVNPMFIPECCREGWESCPHTVKKQGKPRVNIGL